MKCFRRSKTTSWPVNVAKTLLQIAAFWAFFLNLVPAAIQVVATSLGIPSWPNPWLTGVGCLLFAVAGGIGVFCGLTFAVHGNGTPLPLDQATQFLVFGAYRYVRNPMAVTGILQGVAVGLILGSPSVVLYALSGIPAWHWLARPAEESDLERRFGDPYQRYQAEVPLWIPRRLPWRAS